MVQREKAWEDGAVVREVFLFGFRWVILQLQWLDTEHTWTSFTTSYSSTSARRSITVLLRMLLKSRQDQNSFNSASESRGIHRLTQEVLPILGFPQLGLERLETVLVILQEADTFHVRHAISLLVVDPIGEVYLMR